MKKSIKIAIICVVCTVIAVITIFCVLKRLKSHREPNLDNITSNSVNEEGLLLEERLFAYLLKYSEDIPAPWSFSDGSLSIDYNEDNLPIFKLKSPDYTYTFELNEDGILYRITKIGSFDQGDYDFMYVYGGSWSYTTEGLIAVATLDISSYTGYNKDALGIVETEPEPQPLHPIEPETSIDTETLTKDSIFDENVKGDDLAYSYLLNALEYTSCPWYGKSYTYDLIRSEDDCLEAYIKIIDGTVYRLQVNRVGAVTRLYKNMPFTENDSTFLMSVGGEWKERDWDGWHLSYRANYSISDFPE
jgi:hypothetical protein